MRSASSRKVTTIKKRPIAGRYLFTVLVSHKCLRVRLCVTANVNQQLLWIARQYSRLDGVRYSVQHVLELARLRPQLVQRTRVVSGVIAASSIAEGALVPKMVASGAAYLRHGECRMEEKEWRLKEGKERRAMGDF